MLVGPTAAALEAAAELAPAPAPATGPVLTPAAGVVLDPAAGLFAHHSPDKHFDLAEEDSLKAIFASPELSDQGPKDDESPATDGHKLPVLSADSDLQMDKVSPEESRLSSPPAAIVPPVIAQGIDHLSSAHSEVPQHSPAEKAQDQSETPVIDL